MSRVRSQNRGYTIVESLIFLVVSATIFVSAMALVGGKQRNTEFSQGINDAKLQLDDIINNISTGYYVKNQAFSCNYNGTVGNGITIGGGSQQQGGNQDCIFIGTVLQMQPQGQTTQAYKEFTLVGQRETAPGSDVGSISEAKPRAIAIGNSVTDSSIDQTVDNQWEYGLTVKRMTYQLSSGGRVDIGAFAVVTDFANHTHGSIVDSEVRTAGLYGITFGGPALGHDPHDVTDSLANPGNYKNDPVSTEVDICFQSAGTQQYGIIIIGSNGRQLNTKLMIYDIGSEPGGLC